MRARHGEHPYPNGYIPGPIPLMFKYSFFTFNYNNQFPEEIPREANIDNRVLNVSAI